MSSHVNKKKPSSLRKKLSNAMHAMTRIGKEVSLIAVMLCGVVVIAASVAYASSVPVEMQSIAIAAIGSIVGTAVVCLTLPKLAQAKVDQHLQDLKTTLQEEARLEASLDKVREAAEQLVEKTRSLERERNELERKIQRLENMRVNVDGARAILRLALLEIDAVIKDFYRKELSHKPPDDIQRGELHEYVGVVEASFKASLGMDLQKVKLREDDDHRIVVSGLSSEFQGLSDLSEDWELFEVRVRKWGAFCQTPTRFCRTMKELPTSRSSSGTRCRSVSTAASTSYTSTQLSRESPGRFWPCSSHLFKKNWSSLNRTINRAGDC